MIDYVLVAAIDKYGVNAQITKAIEELAELIVELAKFQNESAMERYEHKAKIAEEVADVEIMIEQLKHIVNIRNSVEMFRFEKLERLKRRLWRREDEENQI